MNLEHWCRQGRDECNCEVDEFPAANLKTFAVVVAVVALCAFASSFFPLGFAPSY